MKWFQEDLSNDQKLCMAYIFESLSPEELNHQFRIPVSISGRRNVIDWVRRREDFPGKQALIELLEAYGADNNVYTLDELRAIGDIGPAATLEDISTYK
jgi:hypothetical protein